MKFFVDSADIEEIKKAVEMGLCDGVTTNPSLISKTGRKFDEVVKDICEVVKGPVSLEVIAMDYKEMLKEARELSSISPQVNVKIPMTMEGIKSVKKCSEEGIKTNVTLVFSPTQALLAAKAGATYVSPFIGRLDDISSEGMHLVEDILQIYENYDFSTEVIVASIRHPLHVVQAALLGAPIATIPFNVIEKLFTHPLTETGIERFLQDWKKVPK